jgi:hypothetical protein
MSIWYDPDSLTLAFVMNGFSGTDQSKSLSFVMDSVAGLTTRQIPTTNWSFRYYETANGAGRLWKLVEGVGQVTRFDTTLTGGIEGTLSVTLVGQEQQHSSDTIRIINAKFGGLGIHRNR